MAEVEKLIENMPLKQKVTQMIMPDFRKWQEANQESPQDLTKVNRAHVVGARVVRHENLFDELELCVVVTGVGSVDTNARQEPLR